MCMYVLYIHEFMFLGTCAHAHEQMGTWVQRPEVDTYHLSQSFSILLKQVSC